MVTALHDLPGWQNTRWGMDSKEIIAAVGPELREIPRQQYGPFYSELSIPKVKIGAYTFSVVFQMDGASTMRDSVCSAMPSNWIGQSSSAS